jgi:penicillin amidase
MAHLRAPGLDVAGVSLPGAPGIIVGHNDRIAWGFTNLHFDVQDLYKETLDDRTGKYVFQGHLEQARLEREIIRVKGAGSIEARFWVTRHGPVIQDTPAGKLALKWTAAEPGMFEFPFAELNRARNWQDFNKALARFPGPGQNAVYADVDGNIGYHATGKLPIRRNFSGDVPLDGASGENEWEGYIPFEQLPTVYNPRDGRVVTANQNPFPVNYPYRVSGWFAPPYRSSQIRAMLKVKDGLRPEDMLRIQKDVYSSFSDYLAHELVKVSERKKATNPNVTDAVALLRGWNGQMDKEQAAPLIVTLTFQYVRKAAANAASPGNGAIYDTYMSTAAIERLLRERPPGWFADYDEMLLKSLSDAVDEGKRMQGSYLSKWVYGKYLQVLIAHPVGHRLPFVARYFDIGPVAMSGGTSTVKQTTRRLGPSERFNADLGDWEKSLLNVTIGQSEHVLSRHYKDQWNAYYYGTSFPMPFKKAEAKSAVTFAP